MAKSFANVVAIKVEIDESETESGENDFFFCKKNVKFLQCSEVLMNSILSINYYRSRTAVKSILCKKSATQ